MTFISWKDEYRIGIAAVDHEHKALIEQLNEIFEHLGQAYNGSQTTDNLGELHGSIAAHFALEESIMADHNYAELSAHKADHERLLDDIRDLMDEFEGPEKLDLDHFAERLSNWFLGHFSTHDARLHKRLKVFGD